MPMDPRGWGKTYSTVKQQPTLQNLVEQLARATYALGYVGPLGVLYPTVNRIKHKLPV